MSKNQPKDRRLNERFPGKPAAFASLQSGQVRMGQILDVSRSGIAFCYLEDIHWQEKNEDRPACLELLCGGVHLSISNTQFRVVRDERLQPGHPFSTLPMRRLAMSFEGLSDEQENLLLSYATF